MQKLAISGLAALFAFAPFMAQAGSLTGDNPGENQGVVIEAEWERAQAIGGYEDPFTALANVFSGTVNERTIQPKILVFENETIEQYRARVGKTDTVRRQ